MASGPLGTLGPLGGPYTTLRRSAVDPVTGNATLGAHTPPSAAQLGGAYLDLLGQRAWDAISAPSRAYSGDLQVWDPATGHASDAALGAASGMAGLAMTGSLPMRVPQGALRSFGGAAAKDDPLAALEAGLASALKDMAPEPRPVSRVDPDAKAWDLYHGTTAGPNFQRFDPSLGKSPGHSEGGALFLAPAPETANFYTSGAGAGAEAGPRVFRTTVEPGRTRVFDLPEMIEADPSLGERARSVLLAERGTTPTPADIARADRLREAYRNDLIASRATDRDINAQLVEYGMEPTATTGATYGHGYLGAVIQMAKEQGLDTAILRGLAEHGGDDQVIALTPGRVRSHYAPDQVLFSGGRGGAAPAAAGLSASPQSDELTLAQILNLRP